MNGLEIALMALGIATLCGGVALAAVKIVELAQWKRKMDAGHSAALRAIEELREAARDTLQAENADFRNAQDWCQRLNDRVEKLEGTVETLSKSVGAATGCVKSLSGQVHELGVRVDEIAEALPDCEQEGNR